MLVNDIKKALELYKHTRLYITPKQEGIYIEDALNLIEQQEQETERLKAQIAVYEGWGLEKDKKDFLK